MQPRNSNLRELPVAPGNTNMSSSHPAANVRPVARATQGVCPEQSSQAVPAGGRGRGPDFAKTEMQRGGEGSGVFRKEAQVSLVALQIFIVYLYQPSFFHVLICSSFTFIRISTMNLMNRSPSVGNKKINTVEFFSWLLTDYLWDQSLGTQQGSQSCFFFFDTEPKRGRGDATVSFKDRRAKAPERGDPKEKGDAAADASRRQKEGVAGQAEFPDPRHQPCSVAGNATTCTTSRTTASPAAPGATTTSTTKAVYSEGAAVFKSAVNGALPKHPRSS